MKKTGKLISAVALLLAAMMLFSACAITYKEVNTAEYVQIAEAGYKNIAINVDKMVVEAQDVTDYINKLIYDGYKTEVANGKNQPGQFAEHDVVAYRVFVYDKDGNLIEHTFGVTKSANTGSDNQNAVSITDALDLPLGYGVNSEKLAEEIEAALLDPDSPVLFEAHKIIYNNVNDKASGLTVVPPIAYLTYNSRYTKASDNDTDGSGDTTTKPVHLAPYFGKEQGENDFIEAIYLGLKKLIETQAEKDPDNPVKPSDATTDVITINVYPTNQTIPTTAEYTKTSTHINYNLDFSGASTSTTYQRGYIKVSLKGAILMDVGAEGAFVLEGYDYPTDAEGTYKGADGTTNLNKKDAKGCSVYVYVDSRTAYECPAYDKAFILEKLEFRTDKTEDADVIEAHRESIRKQLQDECDAAAKKTAKSRLWDAAMNNTTLLKEPKKNVKEYVAMNMDYYKYLYYDPNQYYPSGAKNQKTSSGAYYYADFEEFLLSMYVGSGVTYSSVKDVENALYAEGLKNAKENLLAYHLADALGLRYTEEQLLQMVQEKGTAWAKEQIEAMREAYTPAKDATEEEKKSLANALLYNFGLTGVEQITDDFYTWEDYVEYYGESALHGSYHMDAVMDKLYELNYRVDAEGNEIGTLKYVKQPYKAS